MVLAGPKVMSVSEACAVTGCQVDAFGLCLPLETVLMSVLHAAA